MKSIDREALAKALESAQPPVLFEALPPKYFHEGHLPGARQLDKASAVFQAERLKIARDAAIVVYCASDTCANSHEAAAALEAAGFTDVAVYAGGKKDWVEAGRALVGARVPA